MSSFQNLFLILIHHGQCPWLFDVSPLGYSQGAICYTNLGLTLSKEIFLIAFDTKEFRIDISIN